ncbi:MAG: VTT domain-containing protein [Cyclobacteriaceae bacterium]|nr:VTT domain-containing protein [Cyclobacteriaceae bacterium]
MIRNLIRGLIWFAVIIVAFIFLEDYIQENFRSHINEIRANPGLLYGTFTLSEIVFGIIPPEFFMLVWILDKIDLEGYIVNLSILAVISYGAGVAGYWIGKTFSRTPFFQNRIRQKYLTRYEKNLKRFGGYLVFVGAVTPLPFSAMCMLAGSVNMNVRHFLLISLSRVLRFVVYGWMVWSFPNWFNS